MQPSGNPCAASGVPVSQWLNFWSPENERWYSGTVLQILGDEHEIAHTDGTAPVWYDLDDHKFTLWDSQEAAVEAEENANSSTSEAALDCRAATEAASAPPASTVAGTPPSTANNVSEPALSCEHCGKTPSDFKGVHGLKSHIPQCSQNRNRRQAAPQTPLDKRIHGNPLQQLSTATNVSEPALSCEHCGKTPADFKGVHGLKSHIPQCSQNRNRRQAAAPETPFDKTDQKRKRSDATVQRIQGSGLLCLPESPYLEPWLRSAFMQWMQPAARILDFAVVLQDAQAMHEAVTASSNLDADFDRQMIFQQKYFLPTPHEDDDIVTEMNNIMHQIDARRIEAELNEVRSEIVQKQRELEDLTGPQDFPRRQDARTRRGLLEQQEQELQDQLLQATIWWGSRGNNWPVVPEDMPHRHKDKYTEMLSRLAQIRKKRRTTDAIELCARMLGVSNGRDNFTERASFVWGNDGRLQEASSAATRRR